MGEGKWFTIYVAFQPDKEYKDAAAAISALEGVLLNRLQDQGFGWRVDDFTQEESDEEEDDH